MREIIYNTLSLIIGLLLVMVLLMSIATPEKDKYGKYTSFYKYWTNDKYLCNNFNGVDLTYCKNVKGE